ncbi:hypothetical protein [Paractinoplanes durhamensis]|uniref:hypothetical protein n=1 Tax=Paractinoplanes durhamensis TaxID=113563 RepID=UPI001942E019|nr:hypothetical protein [Actinoplanes durhamensis]
MVDADRISVSGMSGSSRSSRAQAFRAVRTPIQMNGDGYGAGQQEPDVQIGEGNDQAEITIPASPPR